MGTKEAYMAESKARLKEFEAEIEKLKAKLEKKDGSPSLDYGGMSEGIKKQWNKAKDQLDELDRSSQGAWDELKIGTEKALSELGTAIDRAKTRFNQN